jgi:hypothetical protein
MCRAAQNDWSVPHCIGASLVRCRLGAMQQIGASCFGSVLKKMAQWVPGLNHAYLRSYLGGAE